MRRGEGKIERGRVGEMRGVTRRGEKGETGGEMGTDGERGREMGKRWVGEGGESVRGEERGERGEREGERWGESGREGEEG